MNLLDLNFVHKSEDTFIREFSVMN